MFLRRLRCICFRVLVTICARTRVLCEYLHIKPALRYSEWVTGNQGDLPTPGHTSILNGYSLPYLFPPCRCYATQLKAPLFFRVNVLTNDAVLGSYATAGWAQLSAMRCGHLPLSPRLHFACLGRFNRDTWFAQVLPSSAAAGN